MTLKSEQPFKVVQQYNSATVHDPPSEQPFHVVQQYNSPWSSIRTTLQSSTTVQQSMSSISPTLQNDTTVQQCTTVHDLPSVLPFKVVQQYNSAWLVSVQPLKVVQWLIMIYHITLVILSWFIIDCNDLLSWITDNLNYGDKILGGARSFVCLFVQAHLFEPYDLWPWLLEWELTFTKASLVL